jgi:hypothetical protein
MDNEINTSYPGFIYNFNPTNQTAEVQLAIETLSIGLDKGFTLTEKARLKMVPVHFARGGGWSLTFPIPDGTPCYVQFAQRGIDHWLVEGKDKAGFLGNIPAPEFRRHYSINSAVATVGITPVTEAIESFATDGVELRNKEHDQIISLKGDGSINIVSGSTTIVVKKDGDITTTTSGKTTIKADSGIVLDGETQVTKTLTVVGASNLNGGVNAKGGGGATMSIEGQMQISGPINDVQIESHGHPYDWTDGGGSSVTDVPNKA